MCVCMSVCIWCESVRVCVCVCVCTSSGYFGVAPSSRRVASNVNGLEFETHAMLSEVTPQAAQKYAISHEESVSISEHQTAEITVGTCASNAVRQIRQLTPTRLLELTQLQCSANSADRGSSDASDGISLSRHQDNMAKLGIFSAASATNMPTNEHGPGDRLVTVTAIARPCPRPLPLFSPEATDDNPPHIPCSAKERASERTT